MLGVDAINSVLTANSKERELDKKEKMKERKREKKRGVQKYTGKPRETERSRLTGLRICCRAFGVCQPTLKSTGGDSKLSDRVYTDDAGESALLSQLRWPQ